MNQWFERLSERVSIAHDEPAVRSTLQRLTYEAGFAAYAYLSFQAETQIAVSSYPDEWQRRYFDLCYASIDPVIRTARGRQEAFAWSNIVTGRTSKEGRKFFAEAAEFGIRSGITVPIKTGFGRIALLTLASSEVGFAEAKAFNPVDAAASFGQVHSRLELMRLRPTRRSNIRLKSDELTCLRWSAEGKSMKAIAIIENTTYANVCFFLRNAKSALGASTLPQATALAKEFGLI